MGRNSILKERKINPAKRLNIIEGLIEFFKVNSLAQSNMDDVSLALNKSKATLYKYFESKEAMIDSVIEYKIAQIAGFVFILHDQGIPYTERYEKSFKLLEMHISDISNDFLKDLKDVFPDIFLKIEQLIALAVKELAAYYEQGMKDGIFNLLNAKLLSHLDFVFFRMLSDPDFLRANDMTMSSAFKDFYDIRCKGLLVED